MNYGRVERMLLFQLVYDLNSCSFSLSVCAVTFLITLILLGNSEHRNELNRIGYIFDLMDFNHTFEISVDEMVQYIFLSLHLNPYDIWLRLFCS
jgi:hypothetical protein